MGTRINSILQTCFFAISNVMPKAEAIQYIKNAIKKTYGRKGEEGMNKNVLAKIIAGEGDELPVSAFPVDGTYPSGTTKWEKRNIADQVPVWDPDLCSQCGKCYFVCPHASIRVKVYDREKLSDAPAFFKHHEPIGKEFFKDKEAYTLQVSVEDCTGCKLCTEVCPIESKTQTGHKAID